MVHYQAIEAKRREDAIGIVTISRQYGSDGRTVGLRTADRLRYRFINKEIISKVAQMANLPVTEVERFDEQPESAAVRILRRFLAPSYVTIGPALAEHDWWTATTLAGTLPSAHESLSLDEDVFVQLTQEVIVKLAEQGNLVILGRGSQALLADRPDVLHVRVVALQDYRVDVAVRRDGLDPAQARKILKEVDQRRSTYVKRHYNFDWDRASQYDLVVNTAHWGVEGAAALIEHAARSLPYPRS